MKKIKIATLVLVAGLWSFSGCTQQEASQEHGATTTETITEQAYICPMNCEGSASDAPGKCPVCGMDLRKNPNYVAPAVSTSADPTQQGTLSDTAAAR